MVLAFGFVTTGLSSCMLARPSCIGRRDLRTSLMTLTLIPRSTWVSMMKAMNAAGREFLEELRLCYFARPALSSEVQNVTEQAKYTQIRSTRLHPPSPHVPSVRRAAASCIQWTGACPTSTTKVALGQFREERSGPCLGCSSSSRRRRSSRVVAVVAVVVGGGGGGGVAAAVAVVVVVVVAWVGVAVAVAVAVVVVVVVVVVVAAAAAAAAGVGVGLGITR